MPSCRRRDNSCQGIRRRIFRLATALGLLCSLPTAATTSFPPTSCRTPVTNCPDNHIDWPGDWQVAAQQACAQTAPYICLPFNRACNCGVHSILTGCTLIHAPVPADVGSRTARGEAQMDGVDTSLTPPPYSGPWTLTESFTCSCPAKAVFNADGTCSCEPG